MSELPLHPKLVHLPLGLGVATPLVAAGVVACWRMGCMDASAWGVIVVLQGLLVLSCMGAMRSGEAAKDRVKPVVPRGTVCRHKAASKRFLTCSVVTLAVAAAALVPSGDLAWKVAAASVGLGFLGLFLGARAGRTGGELVYVHGSAQVYTESTAPAEAA